MAATRYERHTIIR